MMAPPVVYGMYGSACTNRVLFALFEKDVTDHVLEKIELRINAHKKPEFLALQPFGMIPVLKDGDLTLFESRAIARYVAVKYEGQGTPLYGKTTLEEKAKVEQWLEVESQNFHPPIATLMDELVFSKFRGLTTNEEVVKTNLEKLGKVLDIYEAHLAKNEYVAGDFFSLADLSHVPYLYYLVNTAKQDEVINSRPHVKAWWDKITSRPAWQQVLSLASA